MSRTNLAKDYSIEVVPGQAKQIKLPFTNCLDETRTIEISSSNDLIITSQTHTLQLSQDETVYARFRVIIEEEMLTPMKMTEGIDVFLFTRDASTKAEDCIRIRIKIQNL